MRIRDRQQEDVAQCVEIMRLTHLDSDYPIHWPDDPASFLCGKAEERAWVAVDDDGKASGHVALHHAEDGQVLKVLQTIQQAKASDYAVISRLLVHPRAQGRGLGNLLLDTAVSDSFERGKHPILVVTKETKSAVLFYEALGWKRIGSMNVELDALPDIEMWVYLAPTPPHEPTGPPCQSGQS